MSGADLDGHARAFVEDLDPIDPELADLLSELNRVFQDMVDDGTYQTIYDAWFDAPAGSVTFGG